MFEANRDLYMCLNAHVCVHVSVHVYLFLSEFGLCVVGCVVCSGVNRSLKSA